MADYRQESQEYARGALKATAAINGGAAVAVLTQVTPLLAVAVSNADSGPAAIWSPAPSDK